MSFSDSGWRMIHGTSDRNLDMADEYLEKAQHARDLSSLARYSKKALEYNPNCLEAEGILAFVGCEGRKEKYIANMQKVLDHGERLMREEGLLPDAVGSFWGILETRPYMRMLSDYADMLIKFKCYDEATKVQERMIELNPGDNQGVRWTLSHLYAMSCNTEGAERLEQLFPDDYSAIHWMGHVLLYYRLKDYENAKEHLQEVKKSVRDFQDFIDALGNPSKLEELRKRRSPYGLRAMSVDELMYEYDNYRYVYQVAEGFEDWLKKVAPTL